jgi:uncharacterized membrane protein
MVVAMTRRRWLMAGALWGVALALKPSALIFAPLWLYAFLLRPERVQVVLGEVVALVVINAAALPFWLDSEPRGSVSRTSRTSSTSCSGPRR